MSPSIFATSSTAASRQNTTEPEINQLKRQLTDIDGQIAKVKALPTITELEQQKAQIQQQLSALQSASMKTTTNDSGENSATKDTTFGPAYKTSLRKLSVGTVNVQKGLYTGKKRIDFSSLIF